MRDGSTNAEEKTQNAPFVDEGRLGSTVIELGLERPAPIIGENDEDDGGKRRLFPASKLLDGSALHLDHILTVYHVESLMELHFFQGIGFVFLSMARNTFDYEISSCRSILNQIDSGESTFADPFPNYETPTTHFNAIP